MINEPILPAPGQFWRHRDYGAVLIIRKVTYGAFRCRVPHWTGTEYRFSDAILPYWELTSEVTETEWKEAELRTQQGVAA